jgi:hypothetical protein
VFDDGRDVLALSVQGDGLAEIGGQQDVGLRAQEVGPGDGSPLGRRIKTLWVPNICVAGFDLGFCCVRWLGSGRIAGWLCGCCT